MVKVYQLDEFSTAFMLVMLYECAILYISMKRIFSATVLFILLILTVVALTKVDMPSANAGATTEVGRTTLRAQRQ
jgi:hypothetical protein